MSFVLMNMTISVALLLPCFNMGERYKIWAVNSNPHYVIENLIAHSSSSVIPFVIHGWNCSCIGAKHKHDLK